MSDRLAPTERHAFLHQGRTIYEWDQTLSEVNIYVQLPPGARAKQLYVDITSARLRIGITPGQPYLDVRWPACAAAHMGSKGPLHATSRPDLMCRPLAAARAGRPRQAQRLLLDSGCARSRMPSRAAWISPRT